MVEEIRKRILSLFIASTMILSFVPSCTLTSSAEAQPLRLIR